MLLYRVLSASRLCFAGPSFLQPPEQQPGAQPQPSHAMVTLLPYHSRSRSSDRPCSSCMLSWTTDNVVA